MPWATALIDGNNFYVSCEQSLDPALIGRPVVVLSNNDGCIVARSAEARALGIAMGTPYFKARTELTRQNGGAQLQLRPLRRYEPADDEPAGNPVRRAGDLLNR